MDTRIAQFAAMKTPGRPEFSGNQIVAFNLIGLVYGILVVGLYALIRPQFGAGPKTAVYAGLGAWAMGTLLPDASLMAVAGLFPPNLTVMTIAAAIVESVAAAMAGPPGIKRAQARRDRWQHALSPRKSANLIWC